MWGRGVHRLGAGYGLFSNHLPAIIHNPGAWGGEGVMEDKLRRVENFINFNAPLCKNPVVGAEPQR